MGLQVSVFLTYVGAIILIFLVGKIFVWPLKVMLKLAVSSLIGGALILLINLIAGIWGLVLIPLNLVTAAVAGILGLPGVILLLILFLF